MANSTHILNPGDLIGVMAPSSFVELADIEKSKAVLEESRYKVFVHPQTYVQHNQSAGTHQEKLEALHDLYADPEIKAIWAAGGGNRALYLLDDLDQTLISKNPKPLIGFSDITAPLNAIFANTNIGGWHAQVFKHLHEFEQLDETLKLLTGEQNEISLQDCEILKPGNAQGTLVGGCLSLFHYLPGTNDCPNLQDAILFLEDSGDEISRFDRMFAQMKRMGVFEQIGGLVLGEFHNVGDNSRPFGFSLQDIVLEATDGRDIPVIMNAPFGHGKNLLPLPIGTNATLNTDTKTINW